VKSADLFLLTKKEKLKKNLLSGEQIQMNNNWLEIAVNTTTIVGELLSSFLSEHGAKGVVIGEWKPDSLSEVTVTRSYFPEEETDTISLIQKIQEQLEHYRNSGINTGAGEVSVKVVREEDWANSWKKYFHTFRVGKNMIIKPLWEEYQAQEGELVIDIDPGMAFGTGTHATTKLCLEELELLAEQITDKENYQILDLGTGSGILAMALYLFGFRQITAIDNDPVAVRVATENLEMNKIKANLFRGEIKDCQAKYELIVGNILAEVIISLAEEINEKLKPGGVFIGSGIIRAREEQVIETLTGTGLKYVQTKADGDWLMIRFQKD